MAAVAVLASLAWSRTATLTLAGGMILGRGGDLARALQGQTEYLKTEYGASGDFAFPSLGWAASAEVLFQLRPWLALGFGTGYERRSRKGRVAYSASGYEVVATIRPEVAVVPLTGNLHVLVPLSRRVKLDLSAGGGAYWTRLAWDDGFLASGWGMTGTDVYAFRASRWAFGFQAGIGLEVGLSEKAAIIVQIKGRSAAVSGFVGDWTEKGQGDLWDFSERGGDHRIYLYDWSSGGKSYPLAVLQADPPTGALISNVREAGIDITGVIATVGLKIAIF